MQEEEVFDLNINNYQLNDLYKLFKISDLDENSMKRAKRIMLSMHPDKSKKDEKYFIFFSKAYDILSHVSEYKNSKIKVKDDGSGSVYNFSYKYVLESLNYKEHEEVLNKFIDKNKKRFNGDDESEEYKKWFNEWFNSQFDENFKTSEEEGYGEWLRRKEEDNKEVEADYKNMLVKLERNMSYNVSRVGGRGGDGTYGLNDLRHVYEEGMMPITDEEYDKLKREPMRNYDEYIAEREGLVLPTEEEYKKINKEFEKSKENEDNISTRKIYEMVKEDQQLKEKTNNFWSKLLKITN